MSENEIKPVAWQWKDAVSWHGVKYERAMTRALEGFQIRALFDQSAIDRLAAERDAAVADAERYRWVRLRIGGREAVEDDFKWEYESGECLAQEVDAAIDAARAQERQ